MKTILLPVILLVLTIVPVSVYAGDSSPDSSPKSLPEGETPDPATPQVLPVDVVKAHPDEIKGERLFVEMMGRPARTRVKTIRGDNIVVTIMGGDMPVPLSQIPAHRLLPLSRKVASPDELLGLAVFCHNQQMKEIRDEILEGLSSERPDLRNRVKALRNELEPKREINLEAFLPPGNEGKSSSAAARRPAAGEHQYPSMPPSEWECVGPGGGGAMYTPTISPHDPEVGIITCDMGGVYLTRDGGVNWHILPLRLGRGVAFSPTDPNIMFVGTTGRLYRSGDGGVNWTGVTSSRQYPMCSVWFVLPDPDDGRSYWITYGVGSIEVGHGGGGGNTMMIGVSNNGGASFSDVTKGFSTGSGMVNELALDRGSPVGNRRLFATTTNGLYRSADGGKSWSKAPADGLPNTPLRCILALHDSNTGKTNLLVTAERGGVFRSEDAGETFSPSGSGMGKRDDAADMTIHDLDAPWDNPNIVYAAGTRIWKSTDGGRTWQEQWEQATKQAGWLCVFRPWSHGSGFGIGCCPTRPEVVWYTGGMAFFASKDGGVTWTEQNCNVWPKGTSRATFAGGSSWNIYAGAPHYYWGGQLEVTFAYQVTFDPHRRDVVYCGYADIGGWRSEDGGKSWTNNLGRWNTGIPSEWRNSCYDTAFDPSKPGKFYVACSGKHNLPNSSNTLGDRYDVGGVAVSEDGGKTFRPFNNGLPNKACTTVCVDRRSRNRDRNVLYAGFCGSGVWRSWDDGTKWERISRGLPDNALIWRIRQMQDNTLLLTCVQNRPGGVWKFDQEAEEWKRLDANPEFGSVTDIKTGGEDRPDFVIVADQSSGGGAYISTDKGNTWRKVYSGPCKSIEFSPDGKYLYAAANGIHMSANGGKSWQEMTDLPFNLGFRQHNDLTLNPRNPGELWVSTGGCGMFKGPAVPGGGQ